MPHHLPLLEMSPVTHNTNRLVFPRPGGFDFRPGQATDFALDRDGWRDEKRPFTFTSTPSADHLEFTIKSYPSHNGVTEQIGMMKPGDTVLIDEPWGAIEDRGPGTFIAGGAGVTPFIAILRARLAREGTLAGTQLIFSNKREEDIILRGEFEAMDGLKTEWVLSDEDKEMARHGQIDEAMLDDLVSDYSGVFYVCGPPPMMDDILAILEKKGVSGDNLVTEE